MIKHEHLIADIGGTHARFALCTSLSDIRDISVMKTADFATFDMVVRHYLDSVGNPLIKTAVIGIANPILGDHIKMTNSPWEFSIEQTRKTFGFEQLHLINDFTALALALPHLPAANLVKVGGGEPIAGTPLGVLGPGTGLGVSALIPTRIGPWVPLAAEGGHVSFAPVNEIEYLLGHAASKEFGHVSMERMVSGPGLQFIYRSLCDMQGLSAQELTAPEISKRAISGRDPVCSAALDNFCAILGTAASDLAVTLGARGGIYLGGGIVHRLGDYFARSPFRQRFEDKGRFSSYLAAIPVFVITGEYPALWGAAAHLEAFPDE
jgi:glucokinase